MPVVTQLGDPIDVNTVENGEQTQADVTALSNGSFVVSWLDTQASGDSAIRTQLYDFSGAAIGGNMTVTSALIFGIRMLHS